MTGVQTCALPISLTGDTQFREAADRQHQFMAGQVKGYPSSHCFALIAMTKQFYPHRELICCGTEPPAELCEYLKGHPSHDLSVIFKSAENSSDLSEAAPFTADYPASVRTVWYLCENGACKAPQDDFSKLNLASTRWEKDR